MKTKEINRILLADGYKYSHPPQYPIRTVNQYDYVEARSLKLYNKTLVHGYQGMMKEYFTMPISKREIDEAELITKLQGIDFDRTGWDIILDEYDGYLPITIKAVKEGTLLPNQNVMCTIELTEDDARIFWVVSWLETFLMKVWYPCSVGTRAFFVKMMLMEMAKITSDTPFVDYQYVNFGDRGSSSVESAEIGGAAHLTCFSVSDNINCLKYIMSNYNVPLSEGINITSTIDASEHSTVTSWGKDGEQDFVMNFLEINKNKRFIACVGDSYDIYNFTNFVTTGEFKEKIESEEYPMFIIRPDSGNAVEVIERMLDIMERNGVNYTFNSKGYKVFNKMRLLWGDGINMETMRDILSILILRKYSTENMVFGSGGWLMQEISRDSLGFAAKCSEITFDDGSTREIYKEPITAPNKKSKKGRVTTYINNEGDFVTCIIDDIPEDGVNALHIIFQNGKMIDEEDFFTIRKRVNEFLELELNS